MRIECRKQTQILYTHPSRCGKLKPIQGDAHYLSRVQENELKLSQRGGNKRFFFFFWPAKTRRYQRPFFFRSLHTHTHTHSSVVVNIIRLKTREREKNFRVLRETSKDQRRKRASASKTTTYNTHLTMFIYIADRIEPLAPAPSQKYNLPTPHFFVFFFFERKFHD